MSSSRELSQLAPLITVDASNKITFASTSEVEFGGLAFPTTDGTVGQVLTTDGSGNLSFTSAAGSYGDSDVGTYLSTNGYDTASNIVASIVDSAPVTLDTLNELAAALGDDPNFATTVTNSIATKLAKASNLSDLTNTATARSNLGLGTLATLSSVNAATITDNSVGAAELNVSGNGTSGQVLSSDGDGSFSWATPSSGISNVVEDTTPQLGGNLEIGSNWVGRSANAHMASFDYGTGMGVQLNAGGSTLLTAEKQGTTSVSLTAQAVRLNNITYPSSDGTNGQVLTTNGSGTLSFQDASSDGLSGTTTGSLTTDRSLLGWNGTAWQNYEIIDAGDGTDSDF